MKVGRKIESNILITKILLNFAEWMCGYEIEACELSKICKGLNSHHIRNSTMIFGGIADVMSFWWNCGCGENEKLVELRMW